MISFCKLKKTAYAVILSASVMALCSCTPSSGDSPGSNPGQSSGAPPQASTSPGSSGVGSSGQAAVRAPYTPLMPSAPGEATLSNDVVSVDYTNASDGYVGVKYTGTVSKIKLRITGPDEIVYTYDLKGNDYAFFPLTAGNGTYSVAVYENVKDSEYATAFFETVDVSISNELSPYLYPNQYVNFAPDNDCVSFAADLISTAATDLEAVTLIYNYIITNVTYDYSKASDPPTGYISNPDDTLNTNTGICLDYAVLMVSMLRSQGIPARLEVGYASDAYHAWLSIYITDVGWVNGVVEFTGSTWTLMDPTFGASTQEASLKKFIGDGTNYTLQKIY